MPGIVLLIGVITLLPRFPFQSVGSNTDDPVTFTVLVAVALSLVFSGLLMGQAVHTIADNMEKAFYRIGNWVINKHYIHGPLVSEEWWESHPQLQVWLARRYWGIHDSFKSHRRLFENELGWYFDISVDKRNSDITNLSYDLFREKCKWEFGVDVAKFDQTTGQSISTGRYEQLQQLYPLVATRVSSSGSGRATGFQARYSFCRGMWVVLGLMVVAYAGVLYTPVVIPALAHKPLILKTLNQSQLGLLIWILIGLSLAFADAAGDYKKHYIEYLIADFNAVVPV